MVKRTTHARHQFGCHLKLLLGLTLDYRRSNAWGLTRRGAFSVYPFPHTSSDDAPLFIRRGSRAKKNSRSV